MADLAINTPLESELAKVMCSHAVRFLQGKGANQKPL